MKLIRGLIDVDGVQVAVHWPAGVEITDEMRDWFRALIRGIPADPLPVSLGSIDTRNASPSQDDRIREVRRRAGLP